MEEGTDRRPLVVPRAPSPPPPSGSPGDSEEAAPTSPPPVAAVEEGGELQHPHHHHHHHGHRHAHHQHRRRRMQESITYHVTISPSPAAAFDGAAAVPWFAATTRDDSWSCLVVLLTFWFFASMTLILGFYGSVNLVLGPNSSRLLRANSYFVQDIKLQSDADRPGPLLYGFSDIPPLDFKSKWSEAHNASIPANFHREWVYCLNEGSEIEVSYHVKSQGSAPLALVIVQGEGNFVRWIEDPLLFMSTLSWNLINGTGLVQQKILKSSEYYIALGNLNSLPAEVELNVVIDALLYNTTRAYYNCSLRHVCVMKLSFLGENAAILATSGPQQWQKQNQDGNVWYVTLSYGPRWIMYFVGSGLMSIIVLLAFKILNYFYANSDGSTNSQAAEDTRERTPLLANKDDDNSSLGSSYDSISNDEGDIEEHLDVATKEPKPVGVSGVCDTQHLCTICCDAPKDCFFLPCGHCAACFACGTRVTEEAGTCPICRRRMKKVKKIFTV